MARLLPGVGSGSRETLLVLLVVSASALWASGCAEGVPVESVEGTGQQPVTQPPGEQVPGEQVPGPTAGTSAPAAGQAGPAPYMGEACEMGQVGTCICPETGTEGMRRCLHDPASPTQGTFNATCENCPPPPEPEPMPDAGAGGGAGTGASEPEPEPEPQCDPDDCPEGSFLEEACCTSAGSCGTRSRFGGGGCD